MSRFKRDDDLESFDCNVDVTAGEHHRQSKVKSSNGQQSKGSGGQADEEAALASLRKRMAGRE